MSHSHSDPERSWDHGLEDGDLVALVLCRKAGGSPIAWEADHLVQYVSVDKLRAAQRSGLIVDVRPKGAEEGFEARLTWPASVASASGSIVAVTDERLQYRPASASGRVVTLQLNKTGRLLTPLVTQGDRVVEGQVLAAVVPVQQAFPCAGGTAESTFIAQLSSSSLSERYGAAKALGHFGSQTATHALALKADDTKDHIYVRLEAASSLARRGDDRGLAFIKQCLAESFAQQRLEAVIVLGEVATEAAEHLLIETLCKQGEHPEIRAGAVWALGELGHVSALAALIESFAAVEQDVRIEAARALAKLANEFSPVIIEKLRAARPDQRPGIAWALSKSAQFEASQLLDALVDEDARRWIAYVLGSQPPDGYIGKIEALRERDPEVYFAVTVLWQVMNSWIFGLETYG